MTPKTLEEFIEKFMVEQIYKAPGSMLGPVDMALATAAEILRVAREKAVEVICSGGLRENRAVRLKDLEDYIQPVKPANTEGGE